MLIKNFAHASAFTIAALTGVILAAATLAGAVAVAAEGEAPSQLQKPFETPPAPAPAPARLFMRHMTWQDVKAAIDRGATTVIVPTGGIEQNGPQMVLAKHDTIVAAAAERIASALGNALVAPVVSFVPEGDIDPPTGNMILPGTIGLPEPVFEGMLEAIARSLKHAGFKDIVFIGDHGMSQAAQARVADKLTREWRWAWNPVRVHQIDKYYDDSAQTAFLKAKGETEQTIGGHAGLIDTAELMSVSPASVDLSRLPVVGTDIGKVGGSGEPRRASIAEGNRLLRMRIDAATAQIRAVTQH